MGGTNGITYYDDIYKYNITEGTLTEIEIKLPYGLAKACSDFRVSGFIFGGTNGSENKASIIKFIE